MAVAARAGLGAAGVGLPGHFVVRAERRGRHRLLDPFHGGRLLDRAACEALVARAPGRQALDPRWLAPVTTRQILVRMLNNLKAVYTTLGDWGRALAATERILLLVPDALEELRDRGLLHARLGQATQRCATGRRTSRRAPRRRTPPSSGIGCAPCARRLRHATERLRATEPRPTGHVVRMSLPCRVMRRTYSLSP